VFTMLSFGFDACIKALVLTLQKISTAGEIFIYAKNYHNLAKLLYQLEAAIFSRPY